MSNKHNPVVHVDTAAAVDKDGTFTNDAGDEVKYSTRKQTVRVEVGGFAYPYEIRLEKDQKPYDVGAYQFDWSQTLEFNKKNMGLAKHPRLVALTAAAKA
jgi:hypothetical protein